MRICKGKRNNNLPAAGSSSSSATPPPWIELPRDVTANILRRLAPKEILFSAERVCTTWRSVCAEPSFWRVFDTKYSDIGNRTLLAGKVCRRAVDRSRGEMIEINIRRFGSNGLLRYVSERLTNLKKLTIDSCKAIKPGGLVEAIKNLPRLEELHVFYMWFLGPRDIETIGASCPMLSSFTFNNYVYGKTINCDNRIALSIAKNMPNLRRLRLIGDPLSNEGLLAILDGCPNLELLDLLNCFNVDLECDLGRRCLEQVKALRRPLDSTADCEWDDRDYDINSRGSPSCFEENCFYNPYNDPADFLVRDRRQNKKIVDVDKESSGFGKTLLFGTKGKARRLRMWARRVLDAGKRKRSS